MGLHSPVQSVEQQHLKEFLPEIVPERGASVLSLPPAGVPFQLEITQRKLHWALAACIVYPHSRKRCDWPSSLPFAVCQKQATFASAFEGRSSVHCNGYMKTL